MAIRVFVNRWIEQPNSEGLHIEDPIDNALANVSLSADVRSRNYYAKLGLSRRPDRLYLIKVMQGNLTNAEWASISEIPGVTMVPHGRFDDAISTIKNPVKTKIYRFLDANGIPRTTFDSAPTIGGFLRNMLTELDSTEPGFGDIELMPAEWA